MRADAENVPADYRRWSVTLALLMAAIGAAILTGTEGYLKTAGGAEIYPYFGWILLIAYTVLLALLLAKAKRGSAMVVAIATALQFLTLAGFGVIRQIGQNAGVAKFVDVSTLPEAVQWDTLIAFVVCFLLGVIVIVWMVAQCVRAYLR